MESAMTRGYLPEILVILEGLGGGYGGRTQVSDQARQAVLLTLSPRISGKGRPWATTPLTVTWAFRAGTKQL
jgi:hypothetical protein